MIEPSKRRSRPLGALAAVVMLVAAAVAGGLWLGLRSAAVDEPGARVSAPAADTTPLGASSPQPGLQTLARDVMARTVAVETLRQGAEELGTGWLIDNRGDFVTNAHVIEGRLAVRLRDRQGGSHNGLVIGVDRAADVALVRAADGFSGPPLPVRPGSAEPAIPEDVIAIASSRATGHDDMTQEQLTALHQTVPVVGDLQAGQQPTTQIYADMLELRGALIYSGNSGGPVLDAHGLVIGIVTLGNKSMPVAYAIPITRVLAALQRWEARSQPLG